MSLLSSADATYADIPLAPVKTAHRKRITWRPKLHVGVPDPTPPCHLPLQRINTHPGRQDPSLTFLIDPHRSPSSRVRLGGRQQKKRERKRFEEMAAEKNEMSRMESARKWVAENKLKTVGGLWISAIAGSFAYNWSQPAMKTSVKIIHARLHAQALTLAALAGAAAVEYYDRQYGMNPVNHENQFLQMDAHPQK